MRADWTKAGIRRACKINSSTRASKERISYWQN